MSHRLVHLGGLVILVGLTTAFMGSPAAHAQRVESPVRTASTASQVNASAPVKATYIEFTGPYGAMSATIRAVLTGGPTDLPLLFAETNTNPPIPTYATKPFIVTSASRITGDIVSPMRVTAVPKSPTRSMTEWRIAMQIVDYTTGAVLNNRVAGGIWASNTRPIDTVLHGWLKADLAAFAGRKVFLQMKVLAEPEMWQGRRLDLVEVKSPQFNSLN